MSTYPGMEAVLVSLHTQREDEGWDAQSVSYEACTDHEWSEWDDYRGNTVEVCLICDVHR